MSTARPLRFGLVTEQGPSWPAVVSTWREVESLGLDSVWLTDHFMSDGERGDLPFFEAWTLLAALAAVTSRIRIGVMVTGNTYRNPALLAKEAVTVDHICGGRLDLGVGAGWWEREHAAYGFDFPGPRELVDRFAEALEILRLAQGEGRADFQGTHCRLDDAAFEPKPLQQPHIPLVVGCKGPRMLALTARYADVWNTRQPLAAAAKRAQLLDEQCRRIGRDPSSVVRSIWPRPAPLTSVDDLAAAVDGYRVHGFTDFVFDWPADAAEQEIMRQAARELFPTLRRG